MIKRPQLSAGSAIILNLLAALAALSPAAEAQLVPLSGVSNSEQVRHINSVFKELSSSPQGQAGKLVPSLLESLASLEQNTLLQVYQQLHVLMADPSVVDALVAGLKDKNAEIASGILANCHGNMGRFYNGGSSLDLSAAQIQEIILALGSDNCNVRRNLALVLAQISLPSDTSVQAALIRLLANDPQSGVRVAAANSLSNIGREVYFKNAASIAQAFARALSEDPSPQVRGAAASGLSQMGGKAEAAAPALAKALTDNSSQVRFQALQSIINIGAPCVSSVDELIDMFNGPSDLYRNNSKDRILQAFGAIGPGAARAVPLIIPLLQERSTAAAAARALAGIGAGSEKAVPDLIHMLDSPFPADRQAAAAALGAIGPPARQALPALRRASTDDRSGGRPGTTFHMKQSIQEAIYKIEGTSGSSDS